MASHTSYIMLEPGYACGFSAGVAVTEGVGVRVAASVSAIVMWVSIKVRVSHDIPYTIANWGLWI